MLELCTTLQAIDAVLAAELEELKWHDGLGAYTGLTVAKGITAYHEKIRAAVKREDEVNLQNTRSVAGGP